MHIQIQPRDSGKLDTTDCLDARSLLAVLEAIGHGIFILDAAGDVLHANRSARLECAEGGTLHLLHGRLHAGSPGDDASLQGALRSGLARRFSMVVVNASSHPLGIAAVPLDGRPARAGTPALLVLLGRREVCHPLSIELFAQARRLTLAESRLLRALSAGQRAQEAALSIGVAISTVRTQISSIRQKIGADSLGEISRIVAVLPPVAPLLARDQVAAETAPLMEMAAA